MDKKNRLFTGDETVIKIENPSEELQKEMEINDFIENLTNINLVNVTYKVSIMPQGIKTTANLGASFVFNSLMKSCDEKTQERFNTLLSEATENGARLINDAINEVTDTALKEQGFKF